MMKKERDGQPKEPPVQLVEKSLLKLSTLSSAAGLVCVGVSDAGDANLLAGVSVGILGVATVLYAVNKIKR